MSPQEMNTSQLEHEIKLIKSELSLNEPADSLGNKYLNRLNWELETRAEIKFSQENPLF